VTEGADHLRLLLKRNTSFDLRRLKISKDREGAIGAPPRCCWVCQ